MNHSQVGNQTVGVYFFSHDCRIHDNPILHTATTQVDLLLCVFCYPAWWTENNQQRLISLGEHRALFLQQTLNQLDHGLRSLGQTLVVTDHSPADFIHSISHSLKITHVYHSKHVGVYERREWRSLKRTLSKNLKPTFVSIATHTLFDQEGLPFDLQNLPQSFTQFRKLIEKNTRPNAPLAPPKYLPPSPLNNHKHTVTKPNRPSVHSKAYPFHGGENAALEHMERYFSGTLPAHYKEVRNAIHGWDNSTKFSPWLANGALSPKSLYARLQQYELDVTQNNSTYWVYFELLWREYFQWYAKKHRHRLFAFTGVQPNNKPLTSFYPERFKKWCTGNTPYPLVNACMRELTETGFLSNRGRQIVASCLVNELQLDWRYGAAYFEQQLIDYDVASNWGNWQYLAGVGADTRDKRHFNLDKQTDMFDQDGHYRTRWGANGATYPLDSVDAADWPIG